MSNKHTTPKPGFIVVPHRNGHDQKQQGPFRNMKAARNWISSRIYEAQYFVGLSPEGKTTMIEGRGK